MFSSAGLRRHLVLVRRCALARESTVRESAVCEALLPAEPVHESEGDVLAQQAEDAVVAPVAADVHVALPHPLVAEAQLLHDAQAGGVLRSDRDLHAMQAR